MKVLVLGCGEMGETAVRDLHAYGPFDEVTVATRTIAKARAVMEDLDCGPRVSAVPLDLSAPVDLAALMRPFDVVVNCIGPNYRHEVRVARAAIEAGVDLVDINDDYETTLEMFDLDGAAREAGVTIVLGLGASPGVNNVLVRAAADQLTSVEEIRTAWVMSGSDPGGPALSYHLLHSLSGRALTVSGGRLVEVESFVDGAERIEFPEPVGTVEVFHVGHPEPITLWRTFPDAHYVDDKASFNAPEVNRLIRTLGRLVREAPAAIQVGGRTVDPMDFAAAYLHRRAKALDVPRQGALRVSVTGLKGTKRRTVVFSSAGRLAQGTGIPASIGACMLAEGAVRGAGVRPPEACLDATDFLYEIFTRRHVAELNGWVEEAREPVAARAC
jgi:saccharopine dehydrogenase-like NADP-dependent oxidoreductase